MRTPLTKWTILGSRHANDAKQREAEANALCDRILECMPQTDLKASDFLTYRVKQPLIWYGEQSPRLSRLYSRTALGVIVAGLVSSGLTAVAKGQGEVFAEVVAWVVIGLGILVGLGTGITQIMRPSQKSVAYRVAEATLRREGWDMVHRRGRYKGTNDSDAFGLLVDMVLELEAQTVASDNNQPAAGSS